MESSIQVRFEAFANEGWGKAWLQRTGSMCAQGHQLLPNMHYIQAFISSCAAAGRAELGHWGCVP